MEPTIYLVDNLDAELPSEHTMSANDPDSGDSHPATGGPLAEAIRALARQQHAAMTSIERGLSEIKSDVRRAADAGAETAGKVGRLELRNEQLSKDVDALARENRAQEERLRVLERSVPEKLTERVGVLENTRSVALVLGSLGGVVFGAVVAALFKAFGH